MLPEVAQSVGESGQGVGKRGLEGVRIVRIQFAANIDRLLCGLEGLPMLAEVAQDTGEIIQGAC